MSERIRVIDTQAVEAAEFARKNDWVIVAAEMAAIGLYLTSEPLRAKEVSEISKDPQQRAVLACLARIHVDSLKTAANQTLNPRKTLNFLSEAARTIETVYRNPDVRLALFDVHEDHRGRRHDFAPEMDRDLAKTFASASVLYSGRNADNLLRWGEAILEGQYQILPDSHPTKPLIGIEIQLSKAGRKANVDWERLLSDFDRLLALSKNNPHRIATVASWLVVWGEKLGNEEALARGRDAFREIISQHPEWKFMTENEKKKVERNQLRRLFYRYVAPLATNRKARENLYNRLLG